MEPTDNVIGIDLGTTYCCNAIYRNGKVEIIPNQSGNRITPSYVSFTDMERLVGEAAKNIVSMNSTNTVFDIKRLIGRQFNDKYVQSDLKYFPFVVKEDGKTGKPIIEVDYMSEHKSYYPEQLSAMLLEQLKHEAEDYMGCKITKAVITVPAYFNNTQRQATKDAGEIAGLDVIRIINEPTAAAIAYGINLCEKDKNSDKDVLVFDLGGGTLDVSILNITNGVFEVKATHGDTHLGGEDFDNKLVAYCASEFCKQYKLEEIDVKKILHDSRALRRLRTVCENAKKTLSVSTQTVVQVESFFNSNDLSVKVSRTKFEEICGELFKRCIQPLDNAIDDAKLSRDNLTEVILIGGSTRIPYVREMLRTYFNGKQLRTDINPDEAVAYGAAVQGAILIGKTDKNISDVVLVDVTPLSLGIETSRGEMSKIIDRNTPIPFSKEQIYSTESDNQRTVKIKIFEGERVLTKDNTQLGIFELADLPPMPRGIPRVTVLFDIDANGILQVTATEESTGKSKNIIIKRDSTKLSRDDILKLIDDAQNNSAIDTKIKATLTARNALETYLYSVKRAVETLNILTMSSELTEIQHIILETKDWFDVLQSNSAEIYHTKHLDIEKLITPLIQRLYSEKSRLTKELTPVATTSVENPIIEKTTEPLVEKPIIEKTTEPLVEKPIIKKTTEPLVEKTIDPPMGETPVVDTPIEKHDLTHDQPIDTPIETPAAAPLEIPIEEHDSNHEQSIEIPDEKQEVKTDSEPDSDHAEKTKKNKKVADNTDTDSDTSSDDEKLIKQVKAVKKTKGIVKRGRKPKVVDDEPEKPVVKRRGRPKKVVDDDSEEPKKTVVKKTTTKRQK